MTKDAIRRHICELPEKYQGIASIYMFGSFLKSAKFTDVDIAIVFDQIQDVTQVRRISREFVNCFEIPLHTQIFFEKQRFEIDSFLTAAKTWNKVYG